jgi:hypothetical protein
VHFSRQVQVARGVSRRGAQVTPDLLERIGQRERAAPATESNVSTALED